MAKLRMLVPEATVNYIQNPSFRYVTTGWTADGATLTRVLTAARFGVASMQIVTNGVSVREGAYYRVGNLTAVSEPITVSIYARGTGYVRIRVIANPTGPERYSEAIRLQPNRWQRLEVTGVSNGQNDMRLYIETAGKSAQAVTFYVDGAQMERKPYSTSYCDGDQPGCRWNIMAHNSVSSRNGYTREGGRWIVLAGPERQEENLYMTVVGGLGAAPISNHTQPFSLQSGSFYQNTQIIDRVFTLNFHAKKKTGERDCSPITLSALHQLRTLLMDIVKPDKTRGGEEFWYEYQDGDYPILGRARYDGGLEGDWDTRNQWINSFPVRFLAVTPLVQEDNQDITELRFQDSIILNEIAGRLNGYWSNLNYGMDGSVTDLELGSKQEIIAVGSFTKANNSLLAIHPMIPANDIAYWDGTEWQLLGTGANGQINAVAVAPNGYIYVTGAFTNIGGVACNRIAYWDGSAWNAMGTGLNATGLAIVVSPLGQVFVGGQFTTAGGISANYIARWNGAWAAIGAFAGLNNFVYTVDISDNGLILYVGGDFTDQATNPGSGLTRVASYSIPSGLFTALGTGFNATVRKVLISSSGTLYAGGDFTLSGTTSIAYIAQWNGAIWSALGFGMNGAVHSIAINQDGLLAAAGPFTQAGGVDSAHIALWNGSTWTHTDLDLAPGLAGHQAHAVLFAPNGDLYFGGQTFSSGSFLSYFSSINTVTNRGNAATSPRLFITGSGILRWIENQSTGQRCFFNLDILTGEEVTIDFGLAEIRSSLRGNLLSAPLDGSDFHSFQLLPGDNVIAALMTDGVGARMFMSYTPKHWGADSTQHGDSL